MNTPPACASTAAALALAARAGPYFAVQRWSPGQGWRPLGTLIADPAALPERVGQARRTLARTAGVSPTRVEERVAASIVFAGLASQLVSPLFGAAVAGGVVPRLTLDGLWWRPAASGPWPLAARQPGGTEVGALATQAEVRAAAGLLSEGLHGLTGPLAAAFATGFRLSQQVLRGNVASALAGAAGVLAGVFPQRAETGGELTAQILALGPLRGTGTLHRPDPAQPQPVLTRRSCCLYYRIPGAGLCGDCVLRR